MDFKVTLIILHLGFCISSFPHFVHRQFHYVNLQMTYDNALSYCREKYTDLAAFRSMEDIKRLKRPTLNTPNAWIGLADIPEAWKGTLGKGTNSWRSSVTDQIIETGYDAWTSGEPNNENFEYCVRMNPDSTWSDQNCGIPNQFVCSTETNQTEKKYNFLIHRYRWPDARGYCRRHHTDLPVIESAEDNAAVSRAKPGRSAIWIGLFRHMWAWSDNSFSKFRNWRSGSPNNIAGDEYCVCEDELHKWEDLQCSRKISFICHEDPNLMTTMRMKFETDADMTDPATNTQMLQQLGAKLTSQGLTVVKLQWNIQPTKQKKKDTETLCGVCMFSPC